MKPSLLVIFLLSSFCGLGQKASCDWAIFFPKDSTIIDFAVNSKGEVVCLGEGKNGNLFSMILDEKGKVIHYDPLSPLADEYSDLPQEEFSQDRIVIDKNDNIFFIGFLDERYLLISDYKTQFDEEVMKTDYLYIAQLDKTGKLKELKSAIKYDAGIDLYVPGFAVGAHGLLTCTLGAAVEPADDEPGKLVIGSITYTLLGFPYFDILVRFKPDLSVDWIDALSVDNSFIKGKVSDPGDHILRNFTLDPEGNCYRVFSFNGKAYSGSQEVFAPVDLANEEARTVIIKYDAAGKKLWSRQLEYINAFYEIKTYGKDLIVSGRISRTFELDGFTFEEKKVQEGLMFRLSQSEGKINWFTGDTSKFSVFGAENTKNKRLYGIGEGKLLSYDKNMKATVHGYFSPHSVMFKSFGNKGFLLMKIRDSRADVNFFGKIVKSDSHKLFLAKVSLPDAK